MLRRWIQMIFNLISKAKDLFINRKNTGVAADNVEDAISVLNSNLAKKVNVNHPNITGVLWNKDITTGNTQVINAGGDTMIVGNTSIKLHLESKSGNKVVDDLITKPKIIGGRATENPYTCGVDGFAMVTMKAWYDQTLPLDGGIYLNGEIVAEDYFTFTFQTLCATIPVKVGDVITCTNGFNFSLRILY